MVEAAVRLGRLPQLAKYELVEDVVDNLRAAGVDQLGLLTEQVTPTGGPVPPAPASD